MKKIEKIGVHVYLRPQTKKLIDRVAGGKRINTKGNRSDFVDGILEQYFSKERHVEGMRHLEVAIIRNEYPIFLKFK
ncbi:hypothetical protein [Ammoniphilus resinae]|uniref:hypothetical protein n=1 Tax=Ammoniphilus resinae TaxID=861532 RepID=UPI001AE22A4A|nr:hypothetical protein [Ammoniphilus resinae]